MIKVLIVLRPATGGIRQHVMGLLTRLDRIMVQPIVICPPEAAGISSLAETGVPIIPLDIRGELNLPYDLRAASAIGHLARSEQVDIIHAQGLKAGLLCTWAGARKSRPFKVLCTLHNPLRRYSSRLMDAAGIFLASMVGRGVDHIAAISRAIEAEAVGLLHVPKDRVTLIYNGLDPAPFRAERDGRGFRDRLGIPGDALLVGTVARLIPQKGLQYLIGAAGKLAVELPDTRFVVIGDGPYRATLEAQAEQAGLRGRVIFAGFCHDIPEALSALDLFALPSLEEGFSIAAMEAMSAGKPVVASAVNGLPELVTGETGILVAPGNAGQLAAALRCLLTDRSRRIRMGQAGRDRVSEYFRLETMVEHHVRLYEDLVAEHGRYE